MRRLASLAAALTLLAVSGMSVLAQPADPQEGCDYYEETGHNLCEPFQEYWTNNGGLPVFGYPITEAENELNLDLEQEFLTQYFERERLEHHPENSGTPYEILLGRLGNEVLLEMGRNWFTFPQGDPSDDHYYAETGHAIGDEFWEYWSSNGLDLGDDGVSFAESLALFGYPISEPAMETNTSGDTVLTQWFERARFEMHDSGVLLGLLGNELLELRDGGEPPPAGDVIAEGLDNPRGLSVGDDGMVYAIDSGVPTENCFEDAPPDSGDPVEICYDYTSSVIAINPVDGSVTPVVTGLPEVSFGGEGGTIQDIVVVDGTVYGTTGLGGHPDDREAVFGEFGVDLGWLWMSDGEGGWEKIVDIAAYEAAENPDEGDPAEGGVDSNPYSLAMDGSGSWVVTDAGGNDLLHIDAEGAITTLAVFPDQMVPAPPFLELPEGAEVPQEPVPTGVVQGPDGAFYTGELTGFPFTPGTAQVWRVTTDGAATVYADGFTNVIDLAFDGAGNLFVLEMVAGGLLNADPSDPASAAAQIVMVAPDGTQTDVPSAGLIFATGLAMGADGTAYVSNFGVMPGMGQIVAFEGVGEPGEGPPPAVGDVIAEGLNSPRGIHVAEDGTVYVAQAGTGGDECIPGPTPEGEEGELCFGASGTIVMVAGGEQSDAVSGLNSVAVAPTETLGPHDVVAGEDSLYVMMGGLGPATPIRDENASLAGSLGWVNMVDGEGAITPAVDITAYEIDANPDGGAIDSNPFSLAMDGAGGWIVSDAGMNALAHVDSEGTISTLAVFEDRMVDAPPFLELPEGAQIPMQSVPTGVVQGPDGAFYVGELTGFPFEPGMARVWRVTAEGDAEVYAEGFTNVIDVAFDADDNLYVLEMIAGGLLNASEDDPASAASRIVQVAPDGTQTTVVDSGLIFATGLAVGPGSEGAPALYVSNFGVMPGMGQVIKIDMAAS